MPRFQIRTPFLIATSLSVVIGGVAHAQSAHIQPQKGEAMIVNTGSTNTAGYSLFVSPSGAVRVVQDPRPRQQKEPWAFNKIAPKQSRQLFHDLAAAMPLSRLPAGHGVKSVSFGTSTFIVYKGQRTPDLSFPASVLVRALAIDAEAIASALHVKALPRRPISALTPQLPGH